MWTTAEIATAAIAIIVLIAVVGVRSLSAGRIQVRLADAVIAAMAAGLTLFLSGGISKLIISNTGLTVERAIVSASEQPVTSQVTPLPVVPMEEALKLGLSQIPDYVRREVQALEFVLGSGSYVPGVTQQYLETLSKYPFFRFVVFLNSDQTFFGMIDARKLLALLEPGGAGQTFESLTMLINRATKADRDQLAQLTDFVPVSAAVKSDANKRDVLQRMEAKNTDWLPVLKPNGQFQGIADRSRVIASLILDVTNKVGAATSGQ